LAAGFGLGFAEILAGVAAVNFAAGFVAASFDRTGFAAGLAARFAGLAGLDVRVARAEDEGLAFAAGPLLLVFVFPRAAD